MNKVYLSVWNELAGMWVAVQENAVGRGKKKSKAGVLTALALPAACAAGLMLPSAAWADFCAATTASQYNYTATGTVANCSSWVGGVVGGDTVGSSMFNGMGTGNTQIIASTTQKKLFLSPGSSSGTAYYATLSNGTTGVLFSGLNAGLNASDAVNVSQLTPLVSSLGGGASFNSSTGVVTGPSYTLTNANAITGQSSSTAQNTVGGAFSEVDSALGQLDTSVTAMQGQVTSLQGQMADAVLYDSSAHDSVTLGGVGATMPVALHNVAAGAISASSTDAVNGSQIYGLASSTATALGGGSSVNADGSISAPQYAVGGQTFSNAGDAFSNLDGRTTANTDAISNLQGQMADGVVYDSSAHNAVTFGGVGATTPVALHNVAAGTISAASTDAVNGSQLYATNQQVAQNTSDIADLQSNVSNISGQMANAVSYDSSAHDSITLGGAGATTAVALHNVATGTAATDAVNVGQMNDALAAVSQEAANAANPFVAANGDRASEGAVASGTHATAVGPNAVASGANSVALGAGSVADRDNSVSVGSAGNERQITNVAAGTAGTDAVNVDQLNAATAQSQGYVDSRIAGVQNQIDDAKRSAFGAAAAAMAVAGLPQPTQPGKTMVAAGASHIGGQTGMALGISYVTENNKWVGKLAASSSSQGNTGVTVGAGYQW
ncbi:YadA-like family protein [Paraburkholderia flagellata]|uniref:YadA-like family protein n=1 Tax=Paraburkholderia flagellata TaxID=2883241 RepID=UPI001F438AC2|nr:YadA-like family protein [Paraburkholderia flagellata]